MLVMTHKTGDRIFIGDNVSIDIIECRGGRVRLGYNAPKEVTILRDKVKEREHDADVQDK